MKREEQKKLFQRWFIWATSISFTLTIIYVGFHMWIPGSEIRTLSTDQLSTINSLITKYEAETDTNKKKPLLKAIKNSLKTSLLVSFNNDTNASEIIDTLIASSPPTQLLIILPTYAFEVKSFFWLKGRKVYAELLFWVWFGVISSVLYKAINQYKKGCFSRKLIYDHIAKFFYAPFVAIVLYLCSDLLSSQKLIALDKISYGAIVFVFILGFFSGRAIVLLNRVKDVIIPANAEDQEDAENAQRFDIEGTVMNTTEFDDISLSGCEVSLKSKDRPSRSFNTKVGADNIFKFEDIPEGNYQIEAELNVQDKNLVLFDSKSLFIQKNDITNEINLELALRPRF